MGLLKGQMVKSIGASWMRIWILLVFLKGIDTIFYGRVSYDAWGNFIPEGEVSVPERELWETVHSKRKIVFSRQEKMIVVLPLFVKE